MFDERINSITASNYSIAPELSCYVCKIRLKFNGSCLKQDEITYTHWAIVNINIVYEISTNFDIGIYPTLVDFDDYKSFGYGIGFDRKGKFLVGNEFGRNCIIFGVDMSSSVHVDNIEKDILILGEGSTQGLDGTTLTAEKKNSINFTENNEKFCLSLHYNDANSYLHVNGTEIHEFKAKNSEIAATPLF